MAATALLAGVSLASWSQWLEGELIVSGEEVALKRV